MKTEKFQRPPMAKPLHPHAWVHPDLLEKADHVIGGSGLFALNPLDANTLLVIFGGHVMRVEDEPVFPGQRGDLALQIHDEFVIGAKLEEEIGPADAVNHSCDPNAGFKGQIFLVAMRSIGVGEQICFDYAMCQNQLNYRFECLCGAPNCRRVITGTDWRIPELQRRYSHYFQPYLQEKFIHA